jgi:16S rRNA processing protein RimM
MKMIKGEKIDSDRQGSGVGRNPEPSYVIVGRVSRPHGIRGEVRVEILTDYPERLAQQDTLYLAHPRSPDNVERYPLESVRPHKGILLVKLGGCDDRDAAEGLRGMLVQIPLDEAVPLEEGEYYYFQLVGVDVETETGEWLGRVADVIETGANDVYVVRGPRGEVLLPAIEDVILELDVERREMVVHLLPGMLEESAT